MRSFCASPVHLYRLRAISAQDIVKTKQKCRKTTEFWLKIVVKLQKGHGRVNIDHSAGVGLVQTTCGELQLTTRGLNQPTTKHRDLFFKHPELELFFFLLFFGTNASHHMNFWSHLPRPLMYAFHFTDSSYDSK